MYKNILENKKAVIFDLDGTLVDSMDLWKRAFQKVLEENDMGPLDTRALPTGLNVAQKWVMILGANREYLDLSKYNLKTLMDQTNKAFIELVNTEGLEAAEGFWNLARELKIDKGLKLGLATNTNREVTSRVLENLGINATFDYIVTADEVKTPKPAPDIYEKAAKELHVRPSEILAIEDSVTGSTSASNAGIDVVVIYNGEEPKNRYPEKAKVFVGGFEDLAGNLDKDFVEFVRDDAKSALENQQEPPEDTTPIA